VKVQAGAERAARELLWGRLKLKELLSQPLDSEGGMMLYELAEVNTYLCGKSRLSAN
jgi:hypothetical protein